MKKKVRILQVSEFNQQVPFPLPIADKPLVKGYNIFASGHVGEILVNSFCQVFGWRLRPPSIYDEMGAAARNIHCYTVIGSWYWGGSGVDGAY